MKFIFKKDFLLGLIQPVLLLWVIPFHMYSFNIGEVHISEFLLLIFGLSFISIFLFFVFKAIFNDTLKGSLALSILYVMIFFYFEFYNNIYGTHEWSYLKFFRARYFSLIWVLIFIIFFLLFNRIKKVNKTLFYFITIFLGVLVFSSCIKGLFTYLKVQKNISKYNLYNEKFRTKYSDQLQKTSEVLSDKDKPDIYYIILDAHASQKILSKYYNYDISDFKEKLLTEGFYFTSNSRSNYPHTYLSIPSSLNMKYNSIVSENNDSSFCYASYLLRNSNSAHFLKILGYKFINIPSVWGPAKFGKRESKAFYPIPSDFCYSFFYSILNKTIFGMFLNMYYDHQKQQSILGQLEKLKNIVREDGPKFVFIHFFCPHRPYIFDKNGSFLYFRGNDRLAYTNQLHFIDNEINKILSSILKQSKRPPVIILQADHGPYGDGHKLSKEIENKEDLKDLKFGILSAFHLPNFDNDKLSDNISPVNNFRFIFNHYFGTNFEILEDECVEIEGM